MPSRPSHSTLPQMASSGLVRQQAAAARADGGCGSDWLDLGDLAGAAAQIGIEPRGLEAPRNMPDKPGIFKGRGCLNWHAVEYECKCNVRVAGCRMQIAGCRFRCSCRCSPNSCTRDDAARGTTRHWGGGGWPAQGSAQGAGWFLWFLAARPARPDRADQSPAHMTDHSI